MNVTGDRDSMDGMDGMYEMERALRTTTRCLVCGFTEVRTDEVVDRGVVLLAECPRCDHRWTARPLLWMAPAPVRLAEETPAA
jgi:hypothetical protein